MIENICRRVTVIFIAPCILNAWQCCFHSRACRSWCHRSCPLVGQSCHCSPSLEWQRFRPVLKHANAAKEWSSWSTLLLAQTIHPQNSTWLWCCHLRGHLPMQPYPKIAAWIIVMYPPRYFFQLLYLGNLRPLWQRRRLHPMLRQWSSLKH